MPRHSPTGLGRWLPAIPQQREAAIREAISDLAGADTADLVESLIERNRQIHEVECINLNPATNVMNPRAEAALAAGLGSRPSLGYAGDKYEMGLEAIEEIEVIAADLACRVFDAPGSPRSASAPVRSPTCTPSWRRAGPATRSSFRRRRSAATSRTTAAGAAGLYGLDIHECPVDARRFTVDLDGARRARRTSSAEADHDGCQPQPAPAPRAPRSARSPTTSVRLVLFDAAHACGMFAGRVWPNPLDLGADLMTMSTYKSLGGPAGGLLLTNRADLAERVDAIAYPGLTANFDAGKTAALAITLLDWLDGGHDYAVAMTTTASALAEALAAADMPVFATEQGYTTSHQFAVDATQWNGGHQAALQAARRQHPGVRHRPARRRRVVGTAARHTGDRALGHDGRRHARARRPDRRGTTWRCAGGRRRRRPTFRSRFTTLHHIHP